ncbi:SMP-30/gluconolactonase/LRE family protein [Oceanicola sp. 502str15]|uniref:SMP-30/gluconolactonase/LRE family protein n=1 Tax=Oceanicola sp. 502str15 TaxID=2696061 RepID=UPI002094DAE3|nr:SMP-30/gluconolactonase/LRE family protein [Oceanicola sp. 502str15]MCO6381751.1 5-valerolactone hydrolase [Oceanicola sp. 502str15]
MTLTEISPFSAEDLEVIGAGLNRPECVLAASDGRLYSGDWTLGIAEVAPDGTVAPAIEADLIGQGFLPNGIAMTGEGEFLFANLGAAGGVWRVGRRGEAVAVAREVEGRPIPPANFVLIDGARIWITVSASSRNHSFFTAEETTGQILLLEDGVVRVMAEGLTWTNELRISPDGRHLYVNETFACRTTRYDLGADGSLSNPHRTNYPKGVFPDGLAFDAEGGLWSACVVSNRLIRLGPDGEWKVIFEDLSPDFDRIAEAHAQGRMTRDMIVEAKGQRAANFSSLAFGGSDLKTLYIGGLGLSGIMALKVPVAGYPMAHWS